MTWGTTHFVGNAGLGLVARRTLAIVDTGDVELKSTLWRSIAGDAPLDEVLDQLMSHGLRSLPSFALVQFESDDVTRVVVRGEAVVRLQTASTTRELRADGVRTWVEDVVSSVEQVEILLDDEPTGELFHVLAGAVPASKLVRQSCVADQHAVVADEGWRPTESTWDGPDPVAPVPGQAFGSAHPSISQPADMTLSISDLESLGTHEGSYEVASEAGVATTASNDESLGDYDFIYGRTVARSVQSAAVHRAPDDVTPIDEPVAHAPPPPPPPLVAPAPIASDTGMIDAVPPAAGSAGSPASAGPELGDHDGRTISRASFQAMRASQQIPDAGVPGPNVQAILCASGHPNPPTATNCRTCGVLVTGASVVIAPRPALGVLRLSNGDVVTVDRPQLLGRNPKVQGELGSEVPSLVRIDSPGQGISRLHAAIHLQGWQVLLEDLNSANGTVVTLPGRTPQRLRASEPMLLVPGAVAVLGGEVSFVFEAVP